MSEDLRAVIQQMYLAAIDRVHAGNALQRSLRRVNGALEIHGQRFPIPADGVYVIAIGKAAREMIRAAEEILGERFTAGLAVTKAGTEERRGRVQVLIGSHPAPDERSLKAGDAILSFAQQVPPGALVLCLISGGGSALVESLREGVTLKQMRSVTISLLRRGASIREMNAVRSRMSRIKGGGLLQALQQAEVVNVIVSDVLGDGLQTIASGPTMPPSHIDAAAVLRKYDIELSTAEAVPFDRAATPPTFVIANVSIALSAAAGEAQSLGFEPFILTQSLDGEAREAGRLIGGILSDSARGRTAFGRSTCILAGGETVVTVRGEGVGGRNTEAALAAALKLHGIADCAIGFLATDGDDGPTGAAGAIVDGGTISDDQWQAAEQALEENDSFTLLNALGATWSPGPTGTNVNDLVIGIVG